LSKVMTWPSDSSLPIHSLSVTLTEREPSGPHAEFEILEDGSWDIAVLREKHQRKGTKAIEYVDECRTVRPIRKRRHEKFAAEWGKRLVIRGYSGGGTLRYARKV
jgi:hypothetical protein